MSSIFKGATPTITFSFTDDISTADYALLTFRNPLKGNVICEIDSSHMDTRHEEDVYFVDVFLDQAQTLAMPMRVEAQFNFVYTDGSQTYRVPSEIATLTWRNNLHNSVITLA